MDAPFDLALYEARKDELDPETRRWVDQQLEAYRRLVVRNPLEGFHPYPKQVEYLANRSLIKGFIGGNGTGKSTIGTVDDLVQVCDADAVPSHLRQFKRWDPPVTLRVAGPDDGVLDNTVLEKFRELAPRDQLAGGSFDSAFNKRTRRLSFKNGSSILFNTFKQERDSWAGVEVRRTRFDEEPPGEHGYGLYTESMARLRKWIPDAQISFTMTPLLGLTWVADEFERADSWHVTAGMRDNPHINAEAMIAGLSNLSEAERQAVIDGLFVHFAGAVVNLAPEHVVPAISSDWLKGKAVYVGIDPGIRRGGVVWVAFDRENAMVVFDELYPENLTVPRIAARIMIRNAQWGLEPAQDRNRAAEYFREMLRREEISAKEFEDVMSVIAAPRSGALGRVLYVIDPGGGARELTQAGSVTDQFLKAGIAAMGGNNDRRGGIMQLRARLESMGLLVCDNCEKLRWEAKRWLVASDEIIAEGKAKVKGAEGSFATIGPDHLWDPTRYIAQERLWYTSPVVKAAQHWDPTSGMSPPTSLVTGRRRVEYGPLGSFT